MASNQEHMKQLKSDSVDRISDLPDSVLCKILSLLPTKNAVAASILSTRWKTLFPFFWLPPVKLDLDEKFLVHPERNDSEYVWLCFKFVGFVDKLLNETLSGVPYLESVELKCTLHHYKNEQLYSDEKIVSWVCSALGLNVRKLLLSVFLICPMLLFHSLNGCTTLKRLSLGKFFYVRLPDNFSLPNLKVLELSNLIFVKKERHFFNELVQGCPAMEELCMVLCDLRDPEYICIRAPFLKHLHIEDSCDNSECDIVIDAPNLETLHYDELGARSFSVSQFKSIHHTVIGMGTLGYDDNDEDNEDGGTYGSSNADGVAKLITACSNTTYLYLTDSSIYDLQYSTIQLPAFEKLTSLGLGKVIESGGWAILARLLCNAPNLEELRINQGFGKHKGGYMSFESLLPRPPVCLELRVKKINLRIYKEDEDEMKLIEYFLKNGKVIQKLKLYCLPCKDDSFLSKLSISPRYSKIDFRPRERVDV